MSLEEKDATEAAPVWERKFALNRSGRLMILPLCCVEAAGEPTEWFPPTLGRLLIFVKDR